MDVARGTSETGRLCCRSHRSLELHGETMGLLVRRMPRPHPGSRAGERHNLAQGLLAPVGCSTAGRARGCHHGQGTRGARAVPALQEEVGSATADWGAKHPAGDWGPAAAFPGHGALRLRALAGLASAGE